MSLGGLASRRPRRRPRRGQRGQSLVEFALVIPVFLLILFAIFDFGFLAFARLTLINATREGTRWAVVQADNITGIQTQLNAAGGPVRGNAGGLVQNDLTIQTPVCIPAPLKPACDFSPGGARDAESGDSIRVTTNYTYHSFFARFLGTTISFSASATMVIE
jgi:hypothetical protein